MTITEVRPPASIAPSFNRWEGRLFGALVLSAFLLYGIGSSLANETVGLVLVAVNSIAVTVVGVIGFRLLRNQNRNVGVMYLVTRIAEAILLAGGMALYVITDVSGADNTGYLLGMIALGIGSVPFWRDVGRAGKLAKSFAIWGVMGYVALATGAAIELATGRAVVIALSIPGGLFELAIGIYLLRKGFDRSRDTRQL